RKSQLSSHPLAVTLLAADRRVVGAAADREVVAAHDDTAAVDAARSHDEVRGTDRDQLVAVVCCGAGEGAGFVERAVIQQALDALTNSETAGLVLPFDVVGAAHGSRQLLAPLELLDLRVPGHVRSHDTVCTWIR